jgi:uncharacterized protein involved in exopolysaccharide biosynthesis
MARSNAAANDNGDEVSLVALANVLLRRWKLMLGLPLAVALIAAAISLLLPHKYTATATILPEPEGQGQGVSGGMRGLVAQFGIGVGGGPNSPAFYADVLQSRTITEQVLLGRFAHYRSSIFGDSATLLTMIGAKGESTREQLEDGRKRLDKAMAVRVDNETNIVGISIETRSPRLSADVANVFVDLLNGFNLMTRRSNAAQRRAFVEARVVEVEGELRDAEETLKSFLEQNRQFKSSPDLQFQHERLARQVSIKQEVFTSLRRQYEEARIEEVNDTPVITVIDQAVPPAEKSSPRRRRMVLLAFFLATGVAVAVAFTQEFLERARSRDDADFQALTASWSEMTAPLRAIIPSRTRS